MFCPKCGKEIRGEQRICPDCGEEISYIWKGGEIKEIWSREDAMFSLNTVKRNMSIFSGLMFLVFFLAISSVIVSNVTLVRFLSTGIIIVSAGASFLIIRYFLVRISYLKKKLHS